MNPHLNMDYDPSFEPMARSRAQTWPVNRLDLKPDDQDDHQNGSDAALDETNRTTSGLGTPSSPLSLQPSSSVSPTGSATQSGSLASKKNSSRRNAWGNQSYADLITQAIQSDPQKRLTLSQIYEWMVANVPFFRDKGDSNSSAGWKNSIRHNLSLHNRFVRVQNEGTGKSSWWMINPDAKPGKSSRRRAATMDTQKYERKRGRTKKVLEERRLLSVDGLTGSHSPGADTGEHFTLNAQSPLHPISDFRSRTNSSASSFGRTSPPNHGYDDTTPVQSPHPWSGTDYLAQGDASEFQPQMAELDHKMAQSMKLHDPNHRSPLSNIRQPPPSYLISNGRFTYTPCNGQPMENGSSMYSPLSSVNTSIFSGATFSSIPEEPAKLRQDLPALPANATFRRPMNVPTTMSNGMNASTVTYAHNGQITPGSFPSDLDSFMETLQPGLDCDIDQVIRNELEIGEKLDFDFDIGILPGTNGGQQTNGYVMNGPKNGIHQKW